MEAILIKAFGFLFMILLGYILKRIGLFSAEDGSVLAKVILKVTLPMAIISNFASLQFQPSHLIPILMGFATNFFVIGLVLILTRRMAPARRGFFLINGAGYNLGLCVLPYLQSFFPPETVGIICMFDVSNAMMCFGITFTIAMIVAGGEHKPTKKEIGQILFSSVPFVTYLVMIVMAVLDLHFPVPVYTVAGMIGQANPFLAMFLIGLLFEVKFERSQIKDMAEVVCIRFSTAILFAVFFYFCLPVSLEYRQILALVVFGPILSVGPVYTERCGYSRSVAAVLNSIMLPVSLFIITVLLVLMGI